MDINLYVHSGNDKMINKVRSIREGISLQGCLLKENTSILDPVLVLENPVVNDEVINLSKYNYMKIPEFNRYYFITDIVSLNNNIWEIHAHVDVLYTYGEQIYKTSALVRKSAVGINKYIPNESEFGTTATTSEYVVSLSQSSGNAMFQEHLVLLVAGGDA